MPTEMPLNVKAKWNTGAKTEDDKVIYNDCTLPFDFGSDLEEAVELAGGEAVYDNYLSSAKIQFQNAIRVLGEAGKSEEEITSALVDWKPGQKAAKVVADPVAVLRQRYANAETQEEKDSILAQIMGDADETEEV